MKRPIMLLSAVVLAGAVVLAQDGPKVNKDTGQKKDVRRKLYGEPAKMAEQVGLTEEQQAKVADLIAERDKEIAEIYAKYQKLMLGLMTPQQQTKWNEYYVASTVQRMFQRAALTEEQMGRIRAAVPTLMPDGAPADEKGRSELTQKVWTYVTREILTDEQRAAIGMPAKTPARPDEKIRKDNPPAKGPENSPPPSAKPDEPTKLPPL